VIQFRDLTAVALNLFDRDRGHAVTCNRLFRLAARLRGSRLMAQSYVGKRAIWKGIGGAIRKVVVSALRPHVPAAGNGHQAPIEAAPNCCISSKVL